MAKAPVIIETSRVEDDDPEFVPDLEILSESNRCSCAASDDNPY